MKRVALVIGIGHYMYPQIRDLNTSVRDGIAMHGLFRRIGFDKVETTHEALISVRLVRDKIQQLLKSLGPEDLFVFYFAGHSRFTTDDHRLIFSGITSDDVQGSGGEQLSLKELQRMTAKVQRLFIFDCYRTRSLNGEDMSAASVDFSASYGNVLGDIDAAPLAILSAASADPVPEVRESKVVFADALRDLLSHYHNQQKTLSLSTGSACLQELAQGVRARSEKISLHNHQVVNWFAAADQQTFTLIDADTQFAAPDQETDAARQSPAALRVVKGGKTMLESTLFSQPVQGMSAGDLQALRDKQADQLQAAVYLPPQTLADARVPEMRLIPGGRFIMGSPVEEPHRYDDEGPQREVQIAPFYCGVYALTFAEWDACAGSDIKHKPRDYQWGRDRQPVIDVSWEDAEAYLNWLSQQTGQHYRLLSEAEWEYACRAGTTLPFSTGASLEPEQANFDGNYVYGGSRPGANWMRALPVGGYAANPLGLHDMHGNVWEWVQDHWNDNYEGAPLDGSAWLNGNADRRVLRGGSWVNVPINLRSACRSRGAINFRGHGVGFRVAMDVEC